MKEKINIKGNIKNDKESSIKNNIDNGFQTKIVYYEDELNDEFSGIKKENVIAIDENYKYINNNIFWKILEKIVYGATYLFGIVYCKLVLNLKVVNREVLREYKNKGFYLYGNHTSAPRRWILSIYSNIWQETF